MPIPRRDYFDFLFNDGRGIRTDQLDGDFVAQRSAGVFVAQMQGTVRVSGQVFVWTIQVEPADLEIVLGDTFFFHLPIATSTSSGRIDLEVNGEHRLPLQDASGDSVPERQLSDIGGIWMEATYTGAEYVIALPGNDFDRARQQLDVDDIADNDIVLIGNTSDGGRVWRARSDDLAEALAGKMSPENFRDAIRYGLVVFQDRNPTESDFVNHRIFFDGIVARKVRRQPVPGHDRLVSFREDNLQISQYGAGIYVDRRAADTVPGTPSVGQRYFNRNQNHWEIWEAGNYWNTSQFIAAPQDADGSLWIGEFGNQDLADPHVGREGQIASYPNADGIYVLHRVDSITAQTEDGFRYELEPIFDAHALDNDDIDDSESDVQGTVSGRGLARAVNQNERFTEVEQEILDDLSRITFPHPTDDWQVRQTYFVTDFFANRYSTFLSLGWDSDNRLRALSGDGHVGRLGGHDRGRIYDGSETLRAGLISGQHWLYLRDDGVGSAIVRAPVDGGDSDPEFSIVLRYFSLFADPDSGTLLGLLRRISATEMEVGLLAYNAGAGTITAEDTITVTRAHLDAALGADYAPLPDIHRESATGVYQEVTGAILEGDTLYLMLTDIAKTDGHTVSVLIGFTLAGTPNNRTLTVLAEDAVDELPIPDELTSGILPLEADELFLARDTAAYRLSGPVSIVETDDTISGDGTQDDPLAVAVPYPGPATWPTLAGRPDRPTADEIIAGTSTDESVPSPSDVVALANAHARNARSNTDPFSIAEAPAEGTAPTVSRGDHVHGLPIDGTLEFNPDSGDLGVNVHDVIQHLQETIRYYTDSIDHPADPGGHSAGQMYQTGPFPTTISRVQAQLDVLFGNPSYAARIYRVDSGRNITEFLGESSHFVPLSNNPHSYDFSGDDGIGIPIPVNAHIVILFHAVGGVLVPLRTGDEASDSPGKSYQDADRDFNMVHSVVYDEVHPSVGDDTASHGDGNHIRGNIKIFYDIAYDHGSLLGTAKANTDLQNIDDDLTDGEKDAVRSRIGAADAEITTNIAEVLDITGSDDWVEMALFTDTTDLVGVDRNARFISWLDGNLYLADTSGNVNSRAVTALTLTGMARGPDFFVLLDADAHTTRSAADLSLLGTSALGGRHAVSVQQDNHLRFWSLDLLNNGTISVRRFGVSADGRTISGQTAIFSITVGAINTAFGSDYFTIQALYDANLLVGVIDLHVVSDSEFWILFGGIPLASDISETRTVMLQIVRPDGSNDFSFTGVTEELPRGDGRSFVRIGDGLVYLGYGSGGSVARYEKRSGRAEVYREHQEDRLQRVTSVERTAGNEDGIRDMSPADVRGIADAAIVSQTAQGVLVGNHTQLILWQYWPTQPADPPNPYNSTTGTFRTSFNNWEMTEAAALSTRPNASDPLWIAYGGTDHVAPNDVANRNWSIFAVAAQQYSADRGATWHYPLEDGDNAYRYLLPTGQIWSPALQLASDPLGYIDLLTDGLAYADHDNSSRYHALASSFDATNFNEMRIIARSFGNYDTNGNPADFGAVGEIVITRKRGIWSDFNQTFERFIRNRGTLKLRLDDVQGLEVAEYGGGEMNDDQSANIHDAADQPERRVNFNMNINVATSAQNTIVGFSFFNFPTIFAKCVVTVGVR